MNTTAIKLVVKLWHDEHVYKRVAHTCSRACGPVCVRGDW